MPSFIGTTQTNTPMTPQPQLDTVDAIDIILYILAFLILSLAVSQLFHMEPDHCTITAQEFRLEDYSIVAARTEVFKELLGEIDDACAGQLKEE
ncbi:hypothetical protein HDK77DRAFT_491296 [Phyllosticta capitalensis]|uniref:Uncharacterized protein n=1 Tax=Phyllosticta capitalensis TaxID=121624 RepID=A0ABR1Z4P8_9PEZI